MRPDIAVKWVEALKSGFYKQGTEALRSWDNKFCCLGVLCEIAVIEGVIPKPSYYDETKKYHYCAGAAAFLPTEVVRWAEMRTAEGRLPEHYSPKEGRESVFHFRTLVEINDKAGVGFNTIGNIISQYYEAL